MREGMRTFDRGRHEGGDHPVANAPVTGFDVGTNRLLCGPRRSRMLAMSRGLREVDGLHVVDARSCRGWWRLSHELVHLLLQIDDRVMKLVNLSIDLRTPHAHIMKYCEIIVERALN